MANSLSRSRSCDSIFKPAEGSWDELLGTDPITSIEDEKFEKVFLASVACILAGIERVQNSKINSAVDLTTAVADQIQAVEPEPEKKAGKGNGLVRSQSCGSIFKPLRLSIGLPTDLLINLLIELKMKEMATRLETCLKNANAPAAAKPRWTVEELPSSTEPTTIVAPQTQVFSADPTIYHSSSATKDTYVHDAPKAALLQPPEWAKKLFVKEDLPETSNKLSPEWTKLSENLKSKPSLSEALARLDALKKHSVPTDLHLEWIAAQQTRATPPPTDFRLPLHEREVEDAPISDMLEGGLQPPIPEDSLCRKILTCVPLIGIYTYFKNNNSLKERISRTQDHVLRADYVRIQNHYKIADIIQKCLTVAIIVSAVALTILTSLPVLGAGIIAGSIGVGAAIIGYHAYCIYKNKQYMRNVRNEFPIA